MASDFLRRANIPHLAQSQGSARYVEGVSLRSFEGLAILGVGQTRTPLQYRIAALDCSRQCHIALQGKIAHVGMPTKQLLKLNHAAFLLHASTARPVTLQCGHVDIAVLGTKALRVR